MFRSLNSTYERKLGDKQRKKQSSKRRESLKPLVKWVKPTRRAPKVKPNLLVAIPSINALGEFERSHISIFVAARMKGKQREKHRAESQTPHREPNPTGTNPKVQNRKETRVTVLYPKR